MTRHTAGGFLCVQVAAVLQYAAEKAIESFLPVVLELLASLLEADRKALSSQQPGAHVALVTIMADSYSDVHTWAEWQGNLIVHQLFQQHRENLICDFLLSRIPEGKSRPMLAQQALQHMPRLT